MTIEKYNALPRKEQKMIDDFHQEIMLDYFLNTNDAMMKKFQSRCRVGGKTKKVKALS